MARQNYMVGVEVGVQNGEFSETVLKNWYGTWYMVDAWRYFPENYHNDSANVSNEEHAIKYANACQVAQRYAPRGIVCRDLSVEAAAKFADGFFDLVYLDANHTYDAVLADLNAWRPKIRAGGTFCGHDYVDDAKCIYTVAGVKTAVHKFFGREPDFVTTADWPSWFYVL